LPGDARGSPDSGWAGQATAHSTLFAGSPATPRMPRSALLGW